MATGIREVDDAHGESDCLREALSELLTSLRDALAEPEHDFDLSDDQYLSEKRRRLVTAMETADRLCE